MMQLRWKILCAFVGAAMAAAFALHPPLNSQDYAAWIQAIGSLAALGGVIWTVKTQERYRREEASTTATVVAAAMTLHLSTAATVVRTFQERLDIAAQIDCAPQLFEEILAKLQEVPTWNADDLARLVPLPNHIALKAAGAIDRLNVAILVLEKTVQSAQLRADAGYRKDRAKYFSFILNECWQLFDMASSRMQLVTHAQTSPHH
ncbi:hypothetical protein [Herbaspirillum robiniae]|uniref:hypothetical protein n=1 Tax=Herbaspirillum robiniae TaxID=2014887 RepID=UPI00101AE561|nr:hypothetical protein [Herbaspirillum robiniae]